MIASSPISARQVLIRTPLDTGWETRSSTKEAFIPAQVPGTVASARRAQHAWQFGEGLRFDVAEHYFRCRFEAARAEPGEEVVLRMDGIATAAEVWLNGEKILTSRSMFERHQVDVTGLIQAHNDILIVCRSLTAELREKRRQQPLARWRTRVVSEQQLRWFRTTLLGRAPGFAREPEPVGPWRPVSIERRRRIILDSGAREVSLDGSSGVIAVHLQLRALDADGKPVSGQLIAGATVAPLIIEGSGDRYSARATLRVSNARPWMPHTHGEPNLYPLRAEFQTEDGSSVVFEDVPVGFRSIQVDNPLSLKINGIPVFCRGVVWTPPDVVTLSASPSVVRRRLNLLRDAGFNLVRVAGSAVYEDETFHSLCNELGLLVWQDMMFANMDYPYEDPDFRNTVRAEAEAELSRVGRHPSLAVICGNSEVEQQVGMLGLNSEIGRGPWFGQDLPQIAARLCPGVPYVPSAPCGGDLAFRTRNGIANYFGVGAYRRPLEDVRRAEVQFASECLAFSNLPEPEVMDRGTCMHGVPRDSGASWDFEDVRDHYFRLLYSLDPVALRSTDGDRHRELSRMVSGEVMAEVFGEWRRPGSPCAGGIILWAADVEPGAGWGILDFEGHPKSAYWFLKRLLAPYTVWTTDEGLNGIDIHVANDGPVPLECLLRVSLYRAGEQRVAQSERALTVAKHQAVTLGLEQILGRFVDAAYAYRFGPPGHDLVVVSLHKTPDDLPFAQSFRFPAGRPMQTIAIVELAVTAEAHMVSDGTIEVLLTSRRFAWGVRVVAPGFVADDLYFGIEPGGRRRIVMTPLEPCKVPVSVTITAMNAEGRLSVEVGEP